MNTTDELREAKLQAENHISSILFDLYTDYGFVAECTVDCKQGVTMRSKDEPEYTVELKLK